MSNGGALEGIRVLDFTQMMVGPWATQFLADLGAEVIKVERRGTGDWERGLEAMGELLEGDSPFFLAMNRNKKSLALDLKHPEAKEIIYRLVPHSHAVVENFRPGVLDRLGLGYEDLSAINPRIVYASATGYGPDGPYVERPGQDLLIQAMSGLAAYGGRYEDPPTPCGSSIIDASTALLLAFSIMAGLWHARETGRGQKIDVDLLSTAVALQCQELAAFMNMEREFERSRAGIGGAWLSAPFGIYRTADGWMAIAMASLSVLAELLDLPELEGFDDSRKAYEHRDAIKELVQDRILEHPTEHWLELLGTRDVWCAPVQSFEQVVEDPQVAHNALIETVHLARVGDFRMVGIPMRFSATPGSIRTPPPEVGEHTEQILGELAYEPPRIAELREGGCI